MATDYKKKFSDITQYLPKRYRTSLNTSLLNNLHNKFLTKEESVPVLGYIGDKIQNDDSTYISFDTLDHEVNALTPVMHTKLGTEDYAFTFSDVLKKLQMVGVDTNELSNWGTTQSFNFAPPMDLDKFSNYSRYRWYGHLITPALTLSFNPTLAPEYYVIGKGGVSDWATHNYWVHEDDANDLFTSLGYTFTLDSTIQAIRPIIEYALYLEDSLLLEMANFGVSGPDVDQRDLGYKKEFNQKPLFNLYYSDGSHASVASPIFYYSEGNNFPVDSAMLTRIEIDVYGDYTFEQGLIHDDYILFYKNGSDLKSIWQKGVDISPKYVTKNSSGVIVESDPDLDIAKLGTWITPAQMSYNLSHENRKAIAYGDLHNHFTDIILNQPGFAGNQFGSNNYRNLPSIDLGVGGFIKDFNSNFGLFLGLINQVDNSIPSIIEFGKQQYKQMLSSITEFVTRTLPDYIHDAPSISFPVNDSNSVDPSIAALYPSFTDFMSTRNNNNVFNDTTASIPGWPATLPLLGLAKAFKPSIYFEKRLGTLVVRHHDGHITPIVVSDIDILKGIAHTTFLRSTGVSTPGISGFVPPSRPYKNQFWFDANTNKLKTFAVRSDTVAFGGGLDGEFWYERTTDSMYRYDATLVQFVSANKVDAWKIVDIGVIINQLTLLVESDLYSGLPNQPVKPTLANIFASNVPKSIEYSEYEFAKYAATNNLDLAATDYDPSDAFTWNYSYAPAIVGVTSGTARWYTMYEEYFGTSRPNMEPWILQGYVSKPVWWDNNYADTTGTRLWTNQMWYDIKNDTGQFLALTGPWVKKICVNVNTDALLPPYVSSSDLSSPEALLNAIPIRIADPYSFLDDGPAELAWRISVDYQYDILKAGFKINPIKFINETWGYNNVFVADSYEIDRRAHKKISHKEFLLHGELVDAKPTYGIVDITVDLLSTDTKFTFVCNSNSATGGSFAIYGDVSGLITNDCLTNTPFVSSVINCTVLDYGTDYNIDDTIIFNVTPNTQEFIPSKYLKINGLNQWFVNLNRHNSVDMSIALSNNILRGWELKLAHRTAGLINTELLNIETDSYPLHSDDYTVIIKKNSGVQDFWLNSIRIQLLRAGNVELVNGKKIPIGKGDDWLFRIETFNPNHPILEYYEYDPAGAYKTYFAFEKKNTSAEWHHLTDVTQLVSRTTPLTVYGIEAVANIVFGYVERLQEQGWKFNIGEDPQIDAQTGRVINWQMFIEKFIDQQYTGVSNGTGIILNPFTSDVWFETETGVVSDMRPRSFGDVMTTQTMFDSFGVTIPMHQVQILRNDDLTLFKSDVIIGGIHNVIDSYEHMVMFENYTFDKSRRKLVYDAFLGARVNRLYLATERQAVTNGRLSFGGHYIIDNKVKRNIEASISDMLNYYDADKMIDQSATAKYARALLGYDSKKHMTDIGMSDKTQFGFWRGLIHNKGSNTSIDAFLNSAAFKSASIDEFWAYKLATYGDARKLQFPELKIGPVDAAHNFMKLQFDSEGDTLDPSGGFINISQYDEDRWVSVEDSQGDMLFDAEMIAEIEFRNIDADVIYDLKKNNADIVSDDVEVFELVILVGDTSLEEYWVRVKNTIGNVYYELVNSTTIKFFDTPRDAAYVSRGPFLNGRFLVKCFGPAQPKFNPAKLIDYKNKVIVSDISLWDPARGSHTAEALEIVDIISPEDQAKYNYSLINNDQAYEPLRPWDSVNVGRIWWNTKNLSYIPYSDKNIFPNLDSRLSYWGSLSEWSSVELNEWVESSVHPSKYSELVKLEEGNSDIIPDKRASGDPLGTTYSRFRTWQQRPIAWGYTDEPGSSAPHVSSVGEHSVEFVNDAAGDTVAVLSNGNWDDIFDLSLGMKLSGGEFYYNASNTSDPDNFKLIKPTGEAVVTGLNFGISIGSSVSVNDSGVFLPRIYTY